MSTESLTGQTVLVTGATGFLGGAVVHRLAEDGVKVRALARRPERAGYIRDLDGVEVVLGDITDADRMHEVTQGCDYVLHVAAALSGEIDHQRAVNVGGGRNVMNAAAAAGVKRVVHVSSIAVYGYNYRGKITEDTPMNPGADPYNTSKAEAETAIRAVAESHNLSYSIIRPGMIYGPRSGMWTDFVFKVARRKPTIFIGQGQGSAYPIFVDDVVDLMLVLATHPAAEGEAFNCTPDPSPTFREYLQGYSALVGGHRWISVPPVLLRPLVTLAAALAPEYSQRRDLPDLLTYLKQNITYSMYKARDLLAWEPRVSLDEGIQRCVPYLREKGLMP